MFAVILVAVTLINLGSILFELGAIAGRPTHGIFPGMFVGIGGLVWWMGSFDRGSRPAWVRPLAVVNLVLFAINITLVAVYLIRVFL